MTPVQSSESKNGVNCVPPASRRHSRATPKKNKNNKKQQQQNKTKKSLPEAIKNSRPQISREGRANVASMETRIDLNVVSEKKKKKSRAIFPGRNRAQMSRLWNYSLLLLPHVWLTRLHGAKPVHFSWSTLMWAYHADICSPVQLNRVYTTPSLLQTVLTPFWVALQSDCVAVILWRCVSQTVLFYFFNVSSVGLFACQFQCHFRYADVTLRTCWSVYVCVGGGGGGGGGEGRRDYQRFVFVASSCCSRVQPVLLLKKQDQCTFTGVVIVGVALSGVYRVSSGSLRLRHFRCNFNQTQLTFFLRMFQLKCADVIFRHCFSQAMTSLSMLRQADCTEEMFDAISTRLCWRHFLFLWEQPPPPPPPPPPYLVARAQSCANHMQHIECLSSATSRVPWHSVP